MADIKFEGEKLIVPDHPTIPFIEGDGTGPDIWRASRRVFDAAVEKTYKGARKIEWLEEDRLPEGQKPAKPARGPRGPPRGPPRREA